MTENTKPELERSDSASPELPLDGEIVGIEEARIRVRLETGVIGFVEALAEAEAPSSFQLGQKGRFRILSSADGEAPSLSLISIVDLAAPLSFESDVDRLQNALSLQHSTSIARDDVVPTLDEQHIKQWLDRTKTSLERVRRNRAKRLDEEFYSGS